MNKWLWHLFGINLFGILLIGFNIFSGVGIQPKFYNDLNEK